MTATQESVVSGEHAVPYRIESEYLECLLDDEASAGGAPAEADEVEPALPATDDDALGQHEAQQVYQTIEIGKLRFAIALKAMERTIPVPADMVINPNAGSPCYGKIRWSGQEIFVVSLARIIFGGDGETVAGKIVLMRNRRYAVLCDAVLETTVIHRSEVNWRADDSSRKWLAGTVAGRKLSILDLNGLF